MINMISESRSQSPPSPLSQTVQEFENLRSVLIYGALPGIAISITAVFRLYTLYGIVSLWTSMISVGLFGIFCGLFYLFIRLDSVLSGLAKPCYEILEYKSSTEALHKTLIENANQDALVRNDLILKLRSLHDPPTLRPWDHKLVKCLFNRENNNDTIDNQNYIVVVRFSDRLGNNIFQYTYARVLAEILQLPFLCPTKLSAPFDSLDLCVMPSLFDTKEVKSNRLIHKSKSQLSSTSFFSSHSRDTKFFISSTDFLSTPVSNYAMNTQLYSHSLLVYIVNSWLWPSVLNWRKRMKSITNENSISNSNINPDIVIHVRLGDILWGHHAAYRPLPISFYLTSLDKIFDMTSKLESRSKEGISAKNSEINKQDMYTIVLVTDDPKHIIVDKMKVILCRYLQGDSKYSHTHRGSSYGQYPHCVVNVQSISIATDFNTLLTAKDGLILSVSSFSWWSAALLQWLIRKKNDKNNDENNDDDDDDEQVNKKTKATMSSKGLKMSIDKNEAYDKAYNKAYDKAYDKESSVYELYELYKSRCPTLIVPRYGLFLQQKWTPAPRLLPTIVNVDHCLSLTLHNEIPEGSSTKVINIELSSLTRWEGNTKFAIDNLFR